MLFDLTLIDAFTPIRIRLNDEEADLNGLKGQVTTGVLSACHNQTRGGMMRGVNHYILPMTFPGNAAPS